MTLVGGRKGSGTCCDDCSEPHKDDGCGCVPEYLCVIAELTGGAVGCCQFMHGIAIHGCNSDDYTVIALTCGDISITVRISVLNSQNTSLYLPDGECCFKVILSTGYDEITFIKCGDAFELVLTEEEFDIQVFDSYTDPNTVQGLLTVTATGGVSNSGQFGDIASGDPPECTAIQLNPRSEPPDNPIEPCNRKSIIEAVKTADRVLDLDDPDLFDNEMCWFLAPCKCIPSTVCVHYTYQSVCEGQVTKKIELGLSGCGYGPGTVIVDRGGYVGEDTVTISGTINPNCTITWTVSSAVANLVYTFGLTRVDLNEGAKPSQYINRCKVTIDSDITITGTEDDAGNTDQMKIFEECLCLQRDDNNCPKACFVSRMPPNANPDCYLTTLSGTVMSSCEFGEKSFTLHANTYEDPTAVVQDSIAPPVPSCQIYHAYDGTGDRDFTLPSYDCTTVEGVDPYPSTDVNHVICKFTLFYPSTCTTDADEDPAPINYGLKYEIVQSCGLPTTTDTGVVYPDSASCDPFELIFTVPITTICECGCSSLTIKITL